MKGRFFHPLSIKFRTESTLTIAAISQATITIFIRQFITGQPPTSLLGGSFNPYGMMVVYSRTFLAALKIHYLR